MCGMVLTTVAAPVLVPAILISDAIPPRKKARTEGIEALTRVGGERVGTRVAAVGVGQDGRLAYHDVRGAAVAGGIAACPAGTRQQPLGPAIDADAPPGPGAIAFAPFEDTTVERPNLREIGVSVPRVRDARTLAVPAAEDAQARGSRQIFALHCGPEGRAVLVVADAGESTGVEVFEVVFRRASQ